MQDQNKKNKSEKNVVIDNFKIDKIMEKLKSAVIKNQLKLEDYDEIVWLLKIILKSDVIFLSTKEVDIFLGNICGFIHNTKSTGRDRIIDWYFRELENIEDYEKKNIIKRIAKYSFANIPNDFKGWKSVLDKKEKK
jgi:hypothetical protein